MPNVACGRQPLPIIKSGHDKTAQQMTRPKGSALQHVTLLNGLRRQRQTLCASQAEQPDPQDLMESGTTGEDLRSLSASEAATQIEQERRPRSIWGKIKYFFIGEKLDRKRLAALGLGAVASYGFVSNATYGTGMAVSWIAFVRKTGKSPLMAGQWKSFLTFFAGFWTLQHFLRPFRLTLALGMAPAFDRILTFIQSWTGWNKRNAFGLYLVCFGSLTSFLVFGSIYVFAGPVAFARNA